MHRISNVSGLTLFTACLKHALKKKHAGRITFLMTFLTIVYFKKKGLE
jgi:hypothetical protein